MTSVGYSMEVAAMKEEASLEAKQLSLSFFPLGHHTENHGHHAQMPLVCGLYRVDLEAAAHPPSPAVGAAKCAHFTSVLWGRGCSFHDHPRILGFLACPFNQSCPHEQSGTCWAWRLVARGFRKKSVQTLSC